MAEHTPAEQPEFPGRWDVCRVDGAFGDLGDGVEMAHGIDLVAEEFDTQWPLVGGGEDIDNATT